MNARPIPLALFALTVLLSSFSARAELEHLESDSGVQGPPYAEIEKELESLARAHPDLAVTRTIGHTVQGRALRLLRIAGPAPDTRGTDARRDAVLITGSTHGDEYLGIEDRLPRVFLENRDRLPGLARFLASGGVIHLLPIANPDGYEARKRKNAHEKDLNRDFPIQSVGWWGFTEPETKALSGYLEAEALESKLRLTLDYHCCIGALLYPWSFKKPSPPSVPKLLEDAFVSIGRFAQGLFGEGFLHGRTPQVLGYSAKGTSKDHYYERYGALSFTYEGVKDVEPEKFPAHVEMWDALFAMLADGRISP